MPWKECNVVEERLRFIARLLDGEKMAGLCREFGISRKTGYKIYNRYKDCGIDGLTDRTTERTPANIDHMAGEEGMVRPERFELPTTWFEASTGCESRDRYFYSTSLPRHYATDVDVGQYGVSLLSQCGLSLAKAPEICFQTTSSTPYVPVEMGVTLVKVSQ